MKIPRTFFSYILMLVVTIFISGCVSPQADKQEACESSEHRKKLRILLHKLDTVTFEPSYSELERDQYRLGYASEISHIVGKMVKRQQNKEIAACGMDLSTQQRQIFDQLSLKLQVQAQQLLEYIKLQQTESIKPQLNRINQTCTSCHQQLNLEIQ